LTRSDPERAGISAIALARVSAFGQQARQRGALTFEPLRVRMTAPRIASSSFGRPQLRPVLVEVVTLAGIGQGYPTEPLVQGDPVRGRDGTPR